MRKIAALCLIGFVISPVATAASPDVFASFTSPSVAEGDVRVQAEWLVLEFADGRTTSTFSATPSATVNITYLNSTWISQDTQLGHAEYPVLETSEERSVWLGDFSASWLGKGYIGIRAGNITITAPSTTTDFSFLAPEDVASLANGANSDDTFSHWAAESPVDQVYGTIGPTNVLEILISDLQEMEIFGAEVTCPSSACLMGGGVSSTNLGSAIFEARSFERVAGLQGQGRMLVSPIRMRFGGTALDLAVDGAMRLPKAQLEGPCGCELSSDATLSLQGTFQLHQLAPGDDSRLTANIHGDDVLAFSDEEPLEILQFTRATAVAAIGIAAALAAAKLILGLFTRLSKQEALEHPKRQKIYQYVQEHPGANFREVARNTSIASGTVRHHLTVLERSGHIVEHPHQGTVRLFENHGKFDHNWSDLVLLREPPLAKLHEWLKAHPQSPQKDALEAMELEGWSRSTTQHRLSRLVEGGVATIRLQGRLKIYSVVERSAPKPLIVTTVRDRPALVS